MTIRSTYKSDLQKEQKLSELLDSYYHKHIKHYDFERIDDVNHQLEGIDLILTHKTTGSKFYVDEKAQLDYINNDLPTFAFELYYEKKRHPKKGWLFDTNKKTDFYALATAIYRDEPNRYNSCKITWVNRKKLIAFLHHRNLSENILENYWENKKIAQGKTEIKQLNHKTEGYLYFSSQNKAEKPINLILKLDFLIDNRIAKRLV
jgi:hypothetical protein